MIIDMFYSHAHTSLSYIQRYQNLGTHLKGLSQNSRRLAAFDERNGPKNSTAIDRRCLTTRPKLTGTLALQGCV
ncbi:hypothetical protein BX666DRAFT_1944043 [Dichotomocladium elegans]|nr:hypothetical protein BX666DRAFT_1944043 [Dichotomocladium elegans]